MTATAPVSIAIPTYGRDSVLIDTVLALLALPVRAAEILVVDQTPVHDRETDEHLTRLDAQGSIRWLRLPAPSIPRAMNEALVSAREDIVLFVDDDIRPDPALVSAHAAAHVAFPRALIAGKVLQPWDEAGVRQVPHGVFSFATDTGRWIGEFMGGNFSVPRRTAIDLGGFDENFVSVAYRFEAEFAHRWRAGGGAIRYEPAACIHHLKAAAGGTRTWGEHFRTWRPDHAVGAYYFALTTGNWREFATRPLRAVTTRYHLRRPWGIPATVVAEVRAMVWAARLYSRGPRTLSRTTR